jgi:hypothetical protein
MGGLNENSSQKRLQPFIGQVRELDERLGLKPAHLRPVDDAQPDGPARIRPMRKWISLFGELLFS